MTRSQPRGKSWMVFGSGALLAGESFRVSASGPTLILYEPLRSICGAYESALSSSEQLRLAGATTCREKAQELTAVHKPRVVLMSAYGGSKDEDLELLRRIKDTVPSTAVLVLETDEGSELDIDAGEFIENGADKVLSKRITLEGLFGEIRAAGG